MKLSNSLVTLFLLTNCAILFSSCYKDNEETLYGINKVDCSSVTYSKNVNSIIVNKCATAGCHNQGGTPPELGSYNLDKSKIDRIITRAVTLKTMPTSGPLSNADQATLKCWSDAGTPNN